MSKMVTKCDDKVIKNPKTPCLNFVHYALGLKELQGKEKENADYLLEVYRKRPKEGCTLVYLCKGTSCLSSGEATLKDKFDEILEKENLTGKVQIMETGCRGFCEMGPLVEIFPAKIFYCQVKPEDVERIVKETILEGKIIDDLLFEGLADPDEIPFYKKQVRRVLENSGLIDAENINEAVANNAYKGLQKALELRPEDVINEVKKSGLRGRGGGGFPTGRKWEITRANKSDVKYLICNADEGDPGAFMDRSILESDPHKLIEGMIIAAYAIGANYGYVYVRAEYPLAVQRLTLAIQQAKQAGLLGKNILNSGFDFDLEIVQGAGAFVCGEETALIASIEGKRGMPSVKPPYPAQKGLFGKPTNVNNVETFANVPLILRNGADWFKEVGTENSTGTKIFALTGKVKHTGLVEVPMGITIREIVFDIGGGMPEGKEFKAVQTGGPSGGCIPAEYLDLPIDYESLKGIGAMMGSGGLVVLDNETCMVNFAKFFLTFTQEESCGKCIPCREGTKRMLEILERITKGQGELEDINRLETLATVIKSTSACGLGMSAPNPVLSTLKYFKEEYLAHIEDKKCPAGSCKYFISYHILPTCRGCTLCARVCPVNAISGERKQVHVIDQDKCIKCGQCYEKCPWNCIAKG